MNLELTEEQRQAVRLALESYVSGLREEIVKAEKHAWKEGLRKEKDALNEVLAKLA